MEVDTFEQELLTEIQYRKRALMAKCAEAGQMLLNFADDLDTIDSVAELGANVPSLGILQTAGLFIDIGCAELFRLVACYKTYAEICRYKHEPCHAKKSEFGLFASGERRS